MSEYPSVTTEQLAELKRSLAASEGGYWLAIRKTPSIPPEQISTIDRLFAEKLVTMSPSDAHAALLERCSWGELAHERLNRLIGDLNRATAMNVA